MARVPFSVKLVVLVVSVTLILAWSDASPIKNLPTYDDLVAARAYDEITPTYRKQPKFNAISDPNVGKLKEKPLSLMDPSAFIKLKALKVIPTDSNSPNIMRLYFPRNRNAEKAIKIDVKSDNGKASEPTTSSSINQFSEKELKKDFIEVDDILLVRDPKKIDELLKTQQIEEVSSAAPESSTLQSTESTQTTQSTTNKPEKPNLEVLFNQSLRYKKLVDSFNANKSEKPESFDKSSKDRGLFKREGNPNDQIKDIPETTDKDVKSEETAMNRDFEIVSTSSDTAQAPVTQTIENSMEQVQTTTEVSDKKDVTEDAKKDVNAVQDQTTQATGNTDTVKVANSDDGSMVGASLKDIQADEKALEMEQKLIADGMKAVQQDVQKFSIDGSKLEDDQETLDADKTKFSDDKKKFLADLKLSGALPDDKTDDLDDMLGDSLRDIQTDEKNLEFDQSKIANDTKTVQDDEQKISIDKAQLTVDKALLDMSKSAFLADEQKFLADLESTDTTTPAKIESQLTTTEQPNKTQTHNGTQALKPVKPKIDESEVVGAPLQTSPVDSVQENVAIESAAIEPINDLDEHVCLAGETSTENVKQTLDEVTTPLSSTRSENEDGLVGMALTPANEATVEQNDAGQTSTETEKVSAPIETPKDHSQLTANEKVTDAGETSDVEKSEMVGATLTQSTTIKPDETQVNGETVSTTPKETIADAPTEQTVADPQISSSSQDDTSAAKSADEEDSVVGATLQTTEGPKEANPTSEIEASTEGPINDQEPMLGAALGNNENSDAQSADDDDVQVGASRDSNQRNQTNNNRNENRSGNNNKNERNTSTTSNSESSAESESRNRNEGSSQILITINNNSNSRSRDSEDGNAFADKQSNSGRSNAESNNRNNSDSSNGSNSESDASDSQPDHRGSSQNNGGSSDTDSNANSNANSDSNSESSGGNSEASDPQTSQTAGQNGQAGQSNQGSGQSGSNSGRSGAGSGQAGQSNSDQAPGAGAGSGQAGQSNSDQAGGAGAGAGSGQSAGAGQAGQSTGSGSTQAGQSNSNQAAGAGAGSGQAGQSNGGQAAGAGAGAGAGNGQAGQSAGSGQSGAQAGQTPGSGAQSGDAGADNGDILKLLPGIHPLLTRILLGAATAPIRSGIATAPLRQMLHQRRALIPALPLRPTALRLVKREAREENFVTPQPYESFQPTTTCRPSLIERYRAMSSDEKAEKASRFLEKVMHGVKILSHVDGFLTHRAKSGIKKIHGMFATSEEE